MRVSMGLDANSGMGDEKEWIDTVEKYERVLKKHDMPKGGLAIGPTQEIKMQLAEGNCLSFVGADVIALAGLVEDLKIARGLFPAERKGGKGRVANGV